MRNRTYGGVGGGRKIPAPYPMATGDHRQGCGLAGKANGRVAIALSGAEAGEAEE